MLFSIFFAGTSDLPYAGRSLRSEHRAGRDCEPPHGEATARAVLRTAIYHPINSSPDPTTVRYFVANFRPSSLFHSPRVKSGTATGMLLCLAEVADSSPMHDHSAAS